MKKILAVLLMLSLSLCGCNISDNKDDKLSVVSVIFPGYDFARQIAGDFASVRMLIEPGKEAHTFEPTPKDIIDIENSDIFIYTGGESDVWVDNILSTVDTKKMKIIKLTNVCETVDEEIKEGMSPGKNEEIEPDEHIWTSPVNALKISEEIKTAMCELSPPNSDKYSENFNVLSEKLKKLDDEFRLTVKGAKRNTLVFADRFPFRYFADEYGLDYYAAFPGCAEETQESISSVAFLIDKVKEKNIPVVLYIEFSSHKLADSIAEETGAKTALFHSAHNVSLEDFEKGITYVDIMENNLEILKEALN